MTGAPAAAAFGAAGKGPKWMTGAPAAAAFGAAGKGPKWMTGAPAAAAFGAAGKGPKWMTGPPAAAAFGAAGKGPKWMTGAPAAAAFGAAGKAPKSMTGPPLAPFPEGFPSDAVTPGIEGRVGALLSRSRFMSVLPHIKRGIFPIWIPERSLFIPKTTHLTMRNLGFLRVSRFSPSHAHFRPPTKTSKPT